MAQQTAVDWLEKGFYRNGIGREIPHFLKDLFEQAKAMEKEQIENAFTAGYDYPEKDCEQYYNENYNK